MTNEKKKHTHNIAYSSEFLRNQYQIRCLIDCLFGLSPKLRKTMTFRLRNESHKSTVHKLNGSKYCSLFSIGAVSSMHMMTSKCDMNNTHRWHMSSFNHQNEPNCKFHNKSGNVNS